MTVNSYGVVIMRDREAKDMPMDLALALNSTKELGDRPHREGHTVGILPVRDVQRCGAALHFAGQEGEVQVIRAHKEGLVSSEKVAKER